MKNNNVIYRHATEQDDIEAIARYIYLTDPYIYPSVCSNPESELWKKIISTCYFSKNNIFYHQNILVAELDHKIVGVLCIIACGQTHRFVEDLPTDLSDCSAITGYFLPLIEETKAYSGHNITNLCVDPRLQGMGIGRGLLEYCTRCFYDSELHLDVIADNAPAVNLYKKMEFIITDEYGGFSGTEELLRCYHMKKAALI